MKMKRFLIPALALLVAACSEKIIDESPVKTGDTGYTKTYYTNPVIRNNCADPDVFDDRERTGYIYAYSTQLGSASSNWIPVYRTTDMVNWSYVCDAFNGDKPDWLGSARTWAPNVKYIGGKYVMYFAQGIIGDSSFSGTGVAYSSSPTGPFLWRDLPNHGRLITTDMTGMRNMIDPDYNVDPETGIPYLFVGSFGNQCLWAMQLSEDGLTFVKDCTVEANRVKYAQGIEGTYIHYHNGYHYIFGSTGSCCSGKESTYHLVVARSKSLLGPYIMKNGKALVDYTFTSAIDANTILQNTEAEPGMYPYFAGEGHNASIITDDAGQDWMCYHAYWQDNNYNGRCLCMDQIIWQADGWPSFRTGYPSQTKMRGPKFKLGGGTKAGFDPSDNDGAGPLLPSDEACGGCRGSWSVPQNRYVVSYPIDR